MYMLLNSLSFVCNEVYQVISLNKLLSLDLLVHAFLNRFYKLTLWVNLIFEQLHISTTGILSDTKLTKNKFRTIGINEMSYSCSIFVNGMNS